MDDAPAAAPTTQSTTRQTRFSDVCGSLDELKRLLYEEPEQSASEPTPLVALVDDALSMLERMRLRLHEYEQFRTELERLSEALQKIESPGKQSAGEEASMLRQHLERGRVLSPEERLELVVAAEAIRDVAVHLEQVLYRYKDLTLDIGRAYRTVKGDRGWVLDQAEAQEPLADAPEWERWLPISPHRERILRYLHAGRAHLLTEDDGGPARAPLIQFEDGGIIPLSAVRWSEELGNFYPADAPPHPRGLEYRDRRD